MHVGFEFWSGSNMGDDSRGMIPSWRRGRRAEAGQQLGGRSV